MSGPLAPDLRRQLEALRTSAPEEPLPFIVTLKPGVNSANASVAGMTIEQRVPEPPLVMGTMTPAQALAAARADTVSRIELDEPGVHALDGLA